MTCSIRIFEKLRFIPKSRLNVFLKVKLPNMTNWHILSGLKFDVLVAYRRLSVRPQNAMCVSRYSASGHLQNLIESFLQMTAQIPVVFEIRRFLRFFKKNAENMDELFFFKISNSQSCNWQLSEYLKDGESCLQM